MKIAVVGLGAVGSQVFWSLSRIAGIEVHGFESAYVGHPFAGAGGESRLYRNLEADDLGYLPIIHRAQELWKDLETKSGRQLRNLKGVLYVGKTDSTQVSNSLLSATELDTPLEVLSTRDIADRFPQFKLRADEVGLWDIEAGVISPELTITAAVGLGVSNGGQLHEYTRVDHLEPRGNGVRLHTAGSFSDFDRVVVACGGWTTQLVPGLRDFVVTKRLTSAWYPGTRDNVLQGLPPFMRAAPRYCYGIPTADGKTVKLGLGFNDHHSTGNPNTVERSLSGEAARAEIERFHPIVTDFLPVLQPNPVRLNTYIESYTRTMHEYVRLHPEDPNIAILTGFSGHGFKISPAIGEAGAQLITEGRTHLNLDFLTRADPLFDIEDIKTGTTTHNPLTSTERA